MLRVRALLLLGPVLVAGCSGGDGGDGGDGLAARVRSLLAGGDAAVTAQLEAIGVPVDASLDGVEVSCPAVRSPAAGDTATCRAALGDVRFDVDVRFEDGGAITLVAVAPAPAP